MVPGQAIAINDSTQTEQFFAASWGQSEGVDTIDRSIAVIVEAPGTVVKAAEFGSVVDVTYELGDVTAERDLQIFMGLYEDRAHVNTVSLEAAAGESTGTTGGGDHPDATCEVISLRSPT